jgi:hypothetical protein
MIAPSGGPDDGRRDAAILPEMADAIAEDGGLTELGDASSGVDASMEGGTSPDASIDGSPSDDSGIQPLVPCDASLPIVLAMDQRNPTFMVVDDAGVYWVNDSLMGNVVSVPLGGGASKVLADRQMGPNSIAVGPTDVLWTETKTGSVKSVKKTGAQQTTLYTGGGNAGLVSDDTGNELVWIEQHSIRNCFLSNCTMTSALLVNGALDVNLSRLIYDGYNLWWMAVDTAGTTKISNCLALGVTGVCDAADVITLAKPTFVTDYAVDAKNVYWFSGTTMYVQPWSFTGPPATLGTQLASAQRLALDGNYLRGIAPGSRTSRHIARPWPRRHLHAAERAAAARSGKGGARVRCEAGRRSRHRPRRRRRSTPRRAAKRRPPRPARRRDRPGRPRPQNARRSRD